MAREPTVLCEFSVSRRLHGSTRPLEPSLVWDRWAYKSTENNPAAECGLYGSRSSVCKDTVPTLTVAAVLGNPWRLDAPPLPELAHVSHPPTFLRRTGVSPAPGTAELSPGSIPNTLVLALIFPAAHFFNFLQRMLCFVFLSSIPLTVSSL